LHPPAKGVIMANAEQLNRIAKEEADHVRSHTSAANNASIDRETEDNIRRWSSQPREAINARIHALDLEWDVERYLEMTASSLALAGVVAGLAGRKRALILSAVVLAFLFQHAVHGWCPPLPLFRSFGIRTRKEIDREKYALKALRGDFKEALAASRR
jgi:hypothetical protein